MKSKSLFFGLAAFLSLCRVSAGSAAEINVRDFGAVGDGVTDDTAALQRAADALGSSKMAHEANCLNGCDRKYVDGPFAAVVFPSGTYRITGPVVFTGNLKLVGEGGARILNATADQETFYVRDNHRLIVEGLSFSGGSVHLRQWTRNRDVSYLKVADCSFEKASDTAIVAVSYKWYKGQKLPGVPAEENVEAVRGENGLYTLVSRGPVSDFTAYNNSTLIIVENSRFTDNATAFWGYSDGVTIRRCSFMAPTGAATPQLRLGNGGRLGVEMYLRDLRLDFPGPAVAGRAAIAFEGGRMELSDSHIVSAADLVAVRSTSRVNEYNTASSFSLRNVTVDTGAAPVLSFKGPTFPNRIYVSGVRTTQAGVNGKRLYAFDVEPDEAFMEGVPRRDMSDNYKNLTGVPTENCCTVVRENVDETVFDVTLPKVLNALLVSGPGDLRRAFPAPDGATFGRVVRLERVFRDETIGRAYRHHPGDDTDKVAALLRAAKEAGGGTVELPSRWITVSRPLELSDGVFLTARGCVGIDSPDREGPQFVIPEGAAVTAKGILFAGGGTAITTTATKGRLTLVDCGFADFKGPAIRAESAVPRGFRIAMTGGNSYTAQLYRGNADVVIDGYWYECCPAVPSRAETPRSFATIVNLRGGSLALRDFLGVPVYFGHFTKPYMSDPAFVRDWVGDYRWIDTSGDLFCKNVRFGGEFRGITAIYAYGKARTYVDGGVNETSSAVARPGCNCIVACDSADCEVTVVDVLAHTYRMAQLAKVRQKDGTYRPHPGARYSNNFPFRLTNDDQEAK